MTVPVIYPVEMERLEPYRLDGVARDLIDKQMCEALSVRMRGTKCPRHFIAETIDLQGRRTRAGLVVMEHNRPRRHTHLTRASCDNELAEHIATFGHRADDRFYAFAGIALHVRVVENAGRQRGNPTNAVVGVDVAYGVVFRRHRDRPHPGTLSDVVQHPFCTLVKDVGGEAVNRVPHLFGTAHCEASYEEPLDRRASDQALGCPAVARAEGQTGALWHGRRLTVRGPRPDVDDAPAASVNGLDAPGEPVPDHADEKVAHRADHEEQPESVADEPRYADHDPAYQDDQPIEKLPGGYLPAPQPLLGVRQHAQADPAHNERPEGADDDEDKERPQEPDRVRDSQECDDLRGKKKKCSQKDHT